MILLSLWTTAMAGDLRGTITDDAGTPLAQADVYAYDLRLSNVGARTSATGDFALRDLPPGRYRLLTRPSDADNALSRFYGDTSNFCDSPLLSVTAESAEDGLDFTLPVGGELSGQLTDPDGALAPAGLQVIARRVDGTATEQAFERITETDDDGVFLLRGLDGPGPWAVEVMGDGYPDQFLGPTYDADDATLFQVTPEEYTDAGVHALLFGVQIEGRVEGPDGPVSDVSVVVYSGGQITTVTTDADGMYNADGLPPGDALSWTEPDGLALTYAPDDDRPTTFAVTQSEGDVLEALDIFPPTQATLRITLEDAASGATVGGPSVTLYNDTYTVGKGRVSDDDGVVEFTNLHGGDYLLYVYAADEGYVDDWQLDETGERQLFTVSAGTENTLTLALPYGAVLSGTVIDDDGAPVYGATVVASADEGELYVSATTDREGRYVISGLPGAQWEVFASYAGYCASDPGWVLVYWPGTVSISDQALLTLEPGAVKDGVDFVLPRDDDHDGMGDRWEEEHGLDPTRDDSLEDADGDGVSNISEYHQGTDPQTPDQPSPSCGCRDRGHDTAAALLLVPLLLHRRNRR